MKFRKQHREAAIAAACKQGWDAAYQQGWDDACQAGGWQDLTEVGERDASMIRDMAWELRDTALYLKILQDKWHARARKCESKQWLIAGRGRM